MQLTSEQLSKIYPLAKHRVDKYLPYINVTLTEFGINTPMRVASFLAQIGHESAQLFYTEEIASGKAYEGRQDLGNNQPGDGVRFKGRGFIQTTGRKNYQLCATKFGIPLDQMASWLMTPEGACRSSGFFWERNNLNKISDRGDVVAVTKIVNGGKNGLAERIKYYENALKVLT